MRFIVFLLLLISGNTLAQGNVAHFSYWKPKPAQASHFESGYKKHLQWHRDHHDKWSWYGWYIISGTRDDVFVDATFNHSWSDFDHPVSPAEDGADNTLNTYPYADFMGGYKLVNLPALSFADSTGLRSKFLRMINLTVHDIVDGKKVVEQLKSRCQSAGIKTFLTFKMVDGGNLSQLLLFIGFNSFGEAGRLENLQDDLSAIQHALQLNVITSITAETLAFRADMSLLQKQ
ncbi:hypothetical protein [Flavihumibacter petaseus]|uniref:Uncharacterized protein n=1 Tax=Flavihumibacter petaseus NBRC 106054 TaxID=1220578 RepID=A0A0E9N220_9BACT|nr:hypothetical protein [Flavihumibacter petaseus]GAO44067.1 hypothetical protein FPE01S_03_01070 [Flavihumibacter petaseus NBRC 106054]